MNNKKVKSFYKYNKKQRIFTQVIEQHCFVCKKLESCEDCNHWCTRHYPIFKIRKCILRSSLKHTRRL